MNLPQRVAALALVAAVGSGCAVVAQPPAAPAAPGPGASAPPTRAAPTASATADATATPAALDLTEPGVAEDLVEDLLASADATRAVMVTVTAREASVAVVKDGAAETWAWRDGRIQQVPTDITYVAQRSFYPSDFDFADIGALFRAAQAVSGSDQDQALQIVDYSAGLVSMSVSTNPESRTVFFNPDGTLLPTLDFTSAWGLQRGYDDVVGARGTASALGFGSATGVYLDGPQADDGTLQRRLRTARTPVIVTPRSETNRLEAFDPARVDPAVVWGVLQDLHEQGSFPLDTTWSCVVDDRAGTGRPRLHFTVGDVTFTTDLEGRRLR